MPLTTRPDRRFDDAGFPHELRIEHGAFEEPHKPILGYAWMSSPERRISTTGGGGGTIYGFEEAEAMMRVMTDGAMTCAEEVREFERAFAALVGVEDAAAVSSCVAGLHLSLMAAGLQPGDEVIIPTIAPATVIGYSRRVLRALSSGSRRLTMM